MLEYRCPTCNRKLFEASGPIAVRIEIMCRTKKCQGIFEPVAHLPRHVTYICSECGLTEHTENPKQDRTYCVPCGRHSLVAVPTVDRQPAPAYFVQQ